MYGCNLVKIKKLHVVATVCSDSEVQYIDSQAFNINCCKAFCDCSITVF